LRIGVHDLRKNVGNAATWKHWPHTHIHTDRQDAPITYRPTISSAGRCEPAAELKIFLVIH